MNDNRAFRRADAIATAFADQVEVDAVALAGSRIAGPAVGLPGAPTADLDLYVYSAEPPALAVRRAIAAQFADQTGRIELDNRFWEPGDEWRDGVTGLRVDLMYRSPAWIEEQLARVLDRHEASIGYSTCFWHNVRYSRPLFDREGWFARLQLSADRPYPDELRQAIVAQNAPLLRGVHSAFLPQLEAALRRPDPVAVNHRLAALLASFFDALFALNRQPHPGEKRLLEYAEAICPRRPPDLSARLTELLTLSVFLADADRTVAVVDVLIGDLEALLGEDDLLDVSGPGSAAVS